MKILLLNPPYIQPLTRDYLCPHTYKGNYSWPAVDLIAISGILSDQELFYIDEVKERNAPNVCTKQIQTINPSLIFIMISSISEEHDLAFIFQLKKTVHAQIAVLGDICTFNYEKLMLIQQIDYVIRDFTNSASIRQIVSGTYKEKLIDFNMNPKFTIGVPKHEIFMKYDYYYPYSLYNHVTPVLTNYGCTFKCKFCNAGNLWFKTREQTEIISELITLKNMGINEIYFKDFTFHCDKNTDLLNLMIQNRFDFVFSCNLRVDVVTIKMLELLKTAGCYLVFYGIESGSQKTRSIMKKNIEENHLREIMQATKRLDIETLNSFILGFPNESADEIKETEQLIFDLDPDYLSLNILATRHGAELEAQTPYSNQKSLDVSTNNGATSKHGKTVEDLRKKVERRFYFHPIRLIRFVRLGLKSRFRIQISFRHLIAMIRRTM